MSAPIRTVLPPSPTIPIPTQTTPRLPTPITQSPTPITQSPLTGKIAWQAQLDGNIAAAPAIGSDLVYIATQGGNLYALDKDTGSERWQIQLTAQIAGGPIISGSILYAGGLLSGESDSGVGVLALNALDGHELWRYTVSGSSMTAPLLYGNFLIFGSDNDTVYAVDTRVAEETWTYSAGAPLDTSPVIANNAVYIADATGTFHAISASTGDPLWKLDVGKRDRILPITYTTLTAAYAGSGTIYLGNVLEGPLYALDAATGTERWRFTTTTLVTPVPTFQAGERSASLITSPPIASADSVYVGISFGPLGIPVPDRAGYIYSIDVTTGRERWHVQAETQVTGRPWVEGNTVYYASNSGILHAADTATGRERWNFVADGPINAPLLLSDNTLYIGTFGGAFYALR